jgi:hypothetical protein
MQPFSENPVSLFPIGIALVLLGWAWSIIIAERVHVKWVVGLLLVPFVALPIFAVRHWDVAKRAIYLIVFGLIILAVSFLL